MKRFLIPVLAALAIPTAVNADWGLFGCAEENISKVVSYWRSGYGFKAALDAVNFNDVKRCRALWKDRIETYHNFRTPSIYKKWRATYKSNSTDSLEWSDPRKLQNIYRNR